MVKFLSEYFSIVPLNHLIQKFRNDETQTHIQLEDFSGPRRQRIFFSHEQNMKTNVYL